MRTDCNQNPEPINPGYQSALVWGKDVKRKGENESTPPSFDSCPAWGEEKMN